MKPEARVIGIDDGFFRKGQKAPVLIIGAVMRGKTELDGVLSTTVAPDGSDSTDRLISMINRARRKPQLKAVMTSSITVAGFNIIDINRLHKGTGIPVIAVQRRAPDMKEVEKALSRLAEKEEKMRLIKKAQPLYTYRKMRLYLAGITLDDAAKVIDQAMLRSDIPEPVRIAHVIASGVTTGETTRRA